MIGRFDQQFVDGGLGTNNPVNQIWNEARDIWAPKDGNLQSLIKCFVSIGTGKPGDKPIADSAWKFLSETLKEISTETEKTAKMFVDTHRSLYEGKRYFRFNVEQGLQGLGMEDHKNKAKIAAATNSYLDWQEIKIAVRESALNLRQEQRLPRGKDLAESQLTFRVDFELSVPVTNNFVGWQMELADMKQKLLDKKSLGQRIYVLHGLGGIGKTQLAVNYMLDTKDEYSSMFWLNANTESSLIDNLIKVGKSIPGFTTSHAEQGDRKKEAAEVLKWFRQSGNSRWLLVYDNLDHFSDPRSKSKEADPEAFDFRDWLPNGSHGSILITTRLSYLGQLAFASHLEKISFQHSWALLRSFCRTMQQIAAPRNPADDIPEELEGAAKVLEKLDGLPLAIVQAGAYMQQTGTSFEDYLSDYEKSWKDLSEQVPVFLTYENGPVHASFMISYRHVQRLNMSAAQILQLWGCLDNKDIWYGLFESAAASEHLPDPLRIATQSRLAFNGTMGVLQEFSLVNVVTRGQKSTYSVHPVVHAWSLDYLNAECNDEILWAAMTVVGCFLTSQAEAAQHDNTKERGDIENEMRSRISPHASRCNLVMLSRPFNRASSSWETGEKSWKCKAALKVAAFREGYSFQNDENADSLLRWILSTAKADNTVHINVALVEAILSISDIATKTLGAETVHSIRVGKPAPSDRVDYIGALIDEGGKRIIDRNHPDVQRVLKRKDAFFTIMTNEVGSSFLLQTMAQQGYSQIALERYDEAAKILIEIASVWGSGSEDREEYHTRIGDFVSRSCEPNSAVKQLEKKREEYNLRQAEEFLALLLGGSE